MAAIRTTTPIPCTHKEIHGLAFYLDSSAIWLLYNTYVKCSENCEQPFNWIFKYITKVWRHRGSRSTIALTSKNKITNELYLIWHLFLIIELRVKSSVPLGVCVTYQQERERDQITPFEPLFMIYITKKLLHSDFSHCK